MREPGGERTHRTNANQLPNHPSLARAVARDQSGLAMLAEVSALLETDGRDEASTYADLAAMLSAARLDTVIALADGRRYNRERAPDVQGLDDIIERYARRAMTAKRPVWCCREPVLQPAGATVRSCEEIAPSDLACTGLDWVLAAPICACNEPFGAITAYGVRDQATFPSLPLLCAIAGRVGEVIRNRREQAALFAGIRRRETAMATVAHDLRSSLGVVWMAARMLGGKASNCPSGVSVIERHVRRMQMLVTDILETGVMTSTELTLERSACAPDVLLAEAVSFVEPLALEKRIRVCIAVAEDVPHAFADARRIEQVLANLIGNAVKFTPQNGTIDTGCHAHEEGVAFFVRDSGPGVPPEHRAHVFERFWKGTAGAPGSGLGLAIAHDIVRAHGGNIWVESEPGQGAKFVFTLPSADPMH